MNSKLIKVDFQRYGIGAGLLGDTSYPLGIEFPDGIFIEDIQFIKDPFVTPESSLESWIEIVMSQKFQQETFELDPGNDDIIKVNYQTLEKAVERIILQQNFNYFNIRVIRNSSADILGFHTMIRTRGGKPFKMIKPGILKRPDKILRSRRGETR